MPGDLIICSNDPYGTEVYSCYYTGENLVGCYEFGDNAKSIENEDIDRFLDSLLGRFCFVVIRPSLAS